MTRSATRTDALESRRPRLLDGFVQDVRYALRASLRSPGFFVLAVLILGLGIGANTAIFSLVSSVLLRPLPFTEPDKLVVLWEDLSAVGGPDRLEPTPATYVEWKQRSRSFDDMAALLVWTYNLTGDGEPERVYGARTTTNLFSLLGMQPLVGRTFAPDDEGPSATPVAVIGEDLWMRRFGGDPGLIGRTINLDGLNRTVIGVVPSDFKFPDERTTIWFPADFTPEELAERNAYFMYVVARLESSTSLKQAQAEMTAISQTLGQENGADQATGATVAALQEEISRPVRPTLFILLASVCAVLLITCANVANLLLARGLDRQREIAVREALGAGRRRVLRQLLTESAVLAAFGVAVGIAFSTLSFEYLARLIPGTFPDGLRPMIDGRVLVFTGGIAILTVLLFGTGPALIAARSSFGETLKRSAGVASVRGRRLRNGLAVAEIALTVLLLAASGLLLRSYAAVLAVDPGFRPDHLLIAETPLAPSRYGDPHVRADFYNRVIERVSAIAGVSSAGYVNYAPLVFKGGRVLIAVEGQPDPPPAEFTRNITSDRLVSDGYLTTMGVPLIRGRQLDERDTDGSTPVVLINEAMARLHWPDADPLGARIKIGNSRTDSPWYTVVGVVGDMRNDGLDAPAAPEMYFSLRQSPGAGQFFWAQNLIVRTLGEPMALAAALRDAVWGIDPDQPVSNMRTMSNVLDAELANRNTQMVLVGAFAGLALLLAMAGLYGVLAYTVAQRTSEIGVRVALGATRGDVLRTVLGTALTLGTLGTAIGLVSAFALTRLLGAFLFGVSPTDPATFMAVAVLLLIVTAAASIVPARRATGVDPMSALRAD